MSKTALRSGVGALATLCALAASVPAAGETFITFTVGDGYDTYALAINADGAVTGAGCGDDFCNGYVRAADGTITTFAGPTLITIPYAINHMGLIAGTYQDDNPPFASHGFLQTPGGRFISFDPTGSTNTAALAINDSGVITGSYNTHGFIRAADGTITTFDPKGSNGTMPTAINANGDIAGFYNGQGFLRMADGTITSFDVKNASYTKAYGINTKDAIVGYCYSGGKLLGFERTPGGRIKTFTFQGSTGTMALGINDKGQITGYYNISGPPYSHGFVGSPKSGFRSFDLPNGSYTQPAGINDSGDIAGTYSAASGYKNGFIRVP